ncbi:hypothetical protein HWV62_9027 [Athelia sp. TMB]|nr:hypothetical protein HWV62_9027 [Athelia sp. TMB]
MINRIYILSSRGQVPTAFQPKSSRRDLCTPYIYTCQPYKIWSIKSTVMPFTSILKTFKKKFGKKNVVVPVQPAGLYSTKRLSGPYLETVNVVGMALAFEMGRTKGSAAKNSVEADKKRGSFYYSSGLDVGSASVYSALATEFNESILALADTMAGTVTLPASDSWIEEAAFDDSFILGVDSDDDPVVEGRDEKDVLALMGFGKPSRKVALIVEVPELSVDLAASVESSDSGASILALSAALGNMFALPSSDSWASEATFDESFEVDGHEQAAAPSDEMVLTVMGHKHGHDLRLAEGVEGAQHAAIQHAIRTNVSPRAVVPLQRLSGNMGPPHPAMVYQAIVERRAHSGPTGAGVETRSGLAVQNGACARQRKESGQPSRRHISAQPFVGTSRSALHDTNGRTRNNTLRRSKAVVSRIPGKENATCSERP